MPNNKLPENGNLSGYCDFSFVNSWEYFQLPENGNLSGYCDSLCWRKGTRNTYFLKMETSRGTATLRVTPGYILYRYFLKMGTPRGTATFLTLTRAKHISILPENGNLSGYCDFPTSPRISFTGLPENGNLSGYCD